MQHRFDKLGQYLRGWLGYFGISEYYRPIPELDEWLRRRVRMCYWKQWRHTRTKIGHLLALGVGKRTAILTGSFAARPAPSRCCTPTRADSTITRMCIRWCRRRRLGAHLPRTLFVPGRDPRGGYRRLPRRPGEVPLSKREDGADGIADGGRRGLPLAGVAARVAEGVSPGAQFRLPASELQALDRVAACAAEVRSAPGLGVGAGTRTHRLRLLWGGDEDRAHTDSLGARGRSIDPACGVECPLIV